jgi:hypothetical protein
MGKKKGLEEWNGGRLGKQEKWKKEEDWKNAMGKIAFVLRYFFKTHYSNLPSFQYSFLILPFFLPVFPLFLAGEEG